MEDGTTGETEVVVKQLLVGRGSDEVTIWHTRLTRFVASPGISEYAAVCVVNLHCWAEAVDQSPIATSIFFGKEYRDGNLRLIKNLHPSLG
jgi:hypothetical protein